MPQKVYTAEQTSTFAPCTNRCHASQTKTRTSDSERTDPTTENISSWKTLRTKGIEYTGVPERFWGYVNNYPQKYYAAYVMYWLSVYTLPVEQGSVLLFTSETKAKQVLPLVTSQFALNELRYFNSLGFRYILFDKFRILVYF